MGKYSDFDTEQKGQMTIEDLFSPPDRMVAVSNIFARARKEMSLAEQKTFVYALSQLEWTKGPEEQSNVVQLDKKTLAQILEFKSDNTDISQHMWEAIKDLAKHSYIEIVDRDKGIYDSGSIITRITMRKNMRYVRVKFEEEYFPLFTGLTGNYITMWSSDIFKMTTKRSVQFYELLRQMSYSKYEISKGVFSYGWGIKALKEMFDIPKDGPGSYMREGKYGGFNRSNFEKRVIDPLCEDLAKCQMINLIVQSDGKYYEKVKKGSRVDGYQFYWTLSNRPAVASATEVKEIQERVDKDPYKLKLLNDIVKGEKKPKKPKKGNFQNFPQQDYDIDFIERNFVVNSPENIRKAEESAKKSKEMTEEQKEDYDKQTENSKQLTMDDFILASDQDPKEVSDFGKGEDEKITISKSELSEMMKELLKDIQKGTF